MAEATKRTMKSGAGNVTDFSLKSRRDLGESDVDDAKQLTKDNLLDDLGALENHHGTSSMRCRVAEVLDSVDSDVRDKLLLALGNPAIRGSWIAQTFQKHGIRLPSASIQRHRRNGCAC